MTPLATYFSKSKLMARFQSHQGVCYFHKKKDVIGDLEVPDDVLDLLFFSAEMDTSVRSNLRHQFESNPLVLRLLFSGGGDDFVAGNPHYFVSIQEVAN